jgi:signal peptidase II
LPFLNIVYVKNTGSAFGMLKSMGNIFFILFTILALSILIMLFIRDKKNKLIYSLLIAGAMGNLSDRILYGYVIDFIDLYYRSFHWPAFNVADSSLTTGIILLIYKTFSKERLPLN